MPFAWTKRQYARHSTQPSATTSSDVIHIEKKQPEHEKKAVDEIQLYRYVSAVEPTDAYNEPDIGADQP